MNSAVGEIVFRPIGVVRNGITEATGVRWEEVISRIELAETYEPALEGIEEFSHLLVLFHFHRPERPPVLQVHPEERPDLPLVGVLATRSPHRPTPIGVTTVELLGRQGRVLTVRGLDALDGTPVLDIKPHLPRGDAPSPVRIPRWLQQLWDEMDRER
jgi:tRNA-Thr(GGU) m(6)t(6)A37 methyltransferase TsaA